MLIIVEGFRYTILFTLYVLDIFHNKKEKKMLIVLKKTVNSDSSWNYDFYCCLCIFLLFPNL